MIVVYSQAEMEKIKNMLANFGWKQIKQVVTEQEVTLTITKILQPFTDNSDHKTD